MSFRLKAERALTVNPIHWFELNAAEAERLAAATTEAAAKRDMLALAESYRQMAARAQAKAFAEVSSPRSIDVGKPRTKKKIK